MAIRCRRAVTIVEAKAELLGISNGHIVLKAAPDAAPIEECRCGNGARVGEFCGKNQLRERAAQGDGTQVTCFGPNGPVLQGLFGLRRFQPRSGGMV